MILPPGLFTWGYTASREDPEVRGKDQEGTARPRHVSERAGFIYREVD